MTKKEQAEVLFLSMRGQYIIGQALDVAIGVMEKAEYLEVSNITDVNRCQLKQAACPYCMERDF